MSWTLTRVMIRITEAARTRADDVRRQLRTDTGGIVTSEWTTLIGIILTVVVAVGVLFTGWLLAKANGVFG